ncbi:1-deoxy-D-xylulose-5-phosphate reductoisomerase [Thermosipho ferrireducens]|uniref:1-deoxy-D-xylulose 5-phosphate reductoisomerase n=1 Tax=Thermosipho ferrireducens TaxID=2571116 RepID=A0ABX7S4T5_9BACT|nr:1-deoxy-D-xylulose-5-phosphate reductoisomerase [Thermosipho ferrireducens]QTA37496.1 1-deoxy-D-xylulose-5-phosphate reductoisomerase [Thermosipho ferrireducens]
MEEKTVVVLGATGSIGLQTFQVIETLNNFRVIGIAFGKNKKTGTRIMKKFKIKHYVAEVQLNEGTRYENIKELLELLRPDIVVSAIPGFAGVRAALDSIPFTKRLALATKEALVCSGPFVKKLCKDYDTELIPIDSEHSAIFQLMESEIKKIMITASGGAVRDIDINEFEFLTPEKILKHPVWNMGKRITIDSATMVNKAFEIIEAYELFGTPIEDIEVYIHPTGTVHGAVLLKDGTVKIHYGYPDMKIPIAFALTYPERCYENYNWPPFENKFFEFYEVDKRKYPAYFYGRAIAKDLARRIAFNAADEVAVHKFVNGEIKFTKIPGLIESVCESINEKVKSIEDVFEIDRLAREIAYNKMNL